MSASNFTYVIRYKINPFQQVVVFSHKSEIKLTPEEIWEIAFSLQEDKHWKEIVEIEEVQHVRSIVNRTEVSQSTMPFITITKRQLKQCGVYSRFVELFNDELPASTEDDTEIKMSLRQARKIGLIK